MDRLKAMAYFVRIVEGGSLTAAADAGGPSVAALVRSLAGLERHLGVRLLNRSTRRMVLTEEGTRYLAWCRRMLAEVDDMEQQLALPEGRIGGVLRMAAPVELGQRHLAPLVNSFLGLHPSLSVDLSLDDQVLPLLEARRDLTLRIGHLPDSGMVARELGHTRLVTCASPDYLARMPVIERPESLRHHHCISRPLQGCEWHYRLGREVRVESITPRLVCNQVRTAVQAAIQGLGIVRVMHYQVVDELADGRLLRILGDFEPEPLPIQWVYPHALALAPRVKAFVDWAGPRLQAGLPRW